MLNLYGLSHRWKFGYWILDHQFVNCFIPFGDSQRKLISLRKVSSLQSLHERVKKFEEQIEIDIIQGKQNRRYCMGR
jgi:hypothetical protein